MNHRALRFISLLSCRRREGLGMREVREEEAERERERGGGINGAVE